MSKIKDKVEKTFEKIQYESEDLVASLQEKIDTEEVNETFVRLKNATTRKISRDLHQIQKELKQINDVDEISAYLDEVKDQFTGFFDSVRSTIVDITYNVDVSEYLDKLSDETSDALSKMTSKVKSLAKEAQLDKKMESLSEKGTEAVNTIKSKSEEISKEVSERSSTIMDKLKEKIGK